MAEEESESVEDESVSQFDILERINDNLESIHGELEKQNKNKLRENVRLGALIVLFAVPLSLMVNIISSYYAYKFFPEVGVGGWHSNLHGLVIILMVLASAASILARFHTYSFWNDARTIIFHSFPPFVKHEHSTNRITMILLLFGGFPTPGGVTPIYTRRIILFTIAPDADLSAVKPGFPIILSLKRIIYPKTFSPLYDVYKNPSSLLCSS